MASHNNSSRLFDKLFSHKKQPGFYFKDVNIFGDRDAAEFVLTALIGDELGMHNPGELDEARRRVMIGAAYIFEILTNNADMFLCLRGQDLFYSSVAEEINGELYADMRPCDIHMLAKGFMRARESFVSRGRENPDNKRQPETRMTHLVDNLLDLQQKSAALPVLNVFTLPIRPDAVGHLRNDLESFIIQPAAVWPPEYFSSEERVMMMDARVLACLPGPCDPSPRIPLLACPGHIRLQLDLETFLNPIANFESLRDRARWACATKGDAAVFAPIDAFLSFANGAFISNKVSVIGVITPWFGMKLGETAARQPEAVQTVILNNMARLGIVIVLRKADTGNGSGSGIEVVLFDPSSLFLQQPSYTGNIMRLQNFRSELFEKIVGWAKQAGVSIVSGWIAGPVGQGSVGQSQDPITMACSFVRMTTLDSSIERDPFEIGHLGKHWVLKPMTGIGSR